MPANTQLLSQIDLQLGLIRGDPDFQDIYNAFQIIAREISQLTRIGCTFDETVTAGQAVSIYTNAGSLRARLANATDNTRHCSGFAPAAVSSGSGGEVRFFGINMQLTGLTPGALYYLDTVNGQFTTTKPSTVGNIVQPVGRALDTDQLWINPSLAWTQL